ncbi:hypothetical protein PHMEG_0004692 [Phytophthora megakarya]|uniref:Polyprotein n=1 Tax=Phytophthora megakarya TaxID=4795 RepID=A0A225WTD7_9STRA|nr:hypothetical protein PHMEG_0004692 [Phytophthora megakarya]
MVPNTRFDHMVTPVSDSETNRMSPVTFRKIVGSLLYFARASRTNIACEVNQLSRHCAKSRKIAWIAAKHVLHYLSGTQDTKLKLNPTRDAIDLITDTYFGYDRVDRKSHLWCGKQTVVAQSRTAAGFTATNNGIQHAGWVKLIVDEILHGHRPPPNLVL